jgi:FKBP-type peptidyl-prolyl cis-trans isomerase
MPLSTGQSMQADMKTLPIFLLSSVLAGSVLGQNNAVKVSPTAPALGASTNAPADPGAGKFKTDLEKHSYAMGVLLAGDIKRQLSRGNYEHDAEIVIKAFSEALRGKPTVITDGEANVILRNYSTEIRKKAEEKRKEDGEKAKVAGEAFLAANKTKDGVQVTASGLQYKVLKAAEGAKAKGDDVVEVHYRGTLVDGTEFDSSYSRGQPASFGLSRVIKGWTEGLQLMPVGSKYQFVIPSELAYGQNGSPPKIPPHSTLIFEVDLLSVKPQVAPPLPSSVTSDIIKVPSADDLKKGAQIEVIKSTDAERLQKEAAEQKKKSEAPKK